MPNHDNAVMSKGYTMLPTPLSVRVSYTILRYHQSLAWGHPGAAGRPKCLILKGKWQIVALSGYKSMEGLEFGGPVPAGWPLEIPGARPVGTGTARGVTQIL